MGPLSRCVSWGHTNTATGPLIWRSKARQCRWHWKYPAPISSASSTRQQRAEDQAKVQAAEEKLAQPLALFVLPRNAGCKVTSAKVVIARESETDHDAHDHEENAPAEADGHEAEHSEFHAEYRLSCSNVAAITTISFPYFDAFPSSEELAVTLITEKSQKAFEVNREHALIDIRGMM
jgi:Protein of unknown function (DUF2796)